MKKQYTPLFCLLLLFLACTQNDSKQKELELKQKELDLKERELNMRENQTTETKPETNAQNPAQKTAYLKTFSGTGFSVSLPTSLNITPRFDDKSTTCDYRVTNDKGVELLQLKSLLNSRFETTDIEELYQAALAQSNVDIAYQQQKSNWFVISGYDRNTGNVIYWRRAVGNRYISDLRMDYPKSSEADIYPYIASISKSFTSY